MQLSSCATCPGEFSLPYTDPAKTEEASKWVLSEADVLALAGSNGQLYIDNLTSALLFIASCQIDPNCSLATKSGPNPPKDTGSPSEVELWMALLAASCFLVSPAIGLLLPFVVFNRVNKNHTAMIVSLGNCLSAGMIFSLGIMHIIPDTVEEMLKTGTIYPLNYLLLIFGFFITLAFDELAHHAREDSFDEEAYVNMPGDHQVGELWYWNSPFSFLFLRRPIRTLRPMPAPGLPFHQIRSCSSSCSTLHYVLDMLHL